MRLLFLSSYYPPYELGGYEQLCLEVTECLLTRGHQVIVLTSINGVTRDVDNAAAHVKRVRYLEADKDYYRPVDFFFRHTWQQTQNQLAVKTTIAQFLPDLAMVFGMWNLSRNTAQWIEQLMPGRVSYYIASYWPTDTDPHSAYWNLPTRRPILSASKKILRSAALARLRREQNVPPLKFEHALCCSNYVRNTLVSAGALPAHARVVYNGIDQTVLLEQFNLRKKHPTRADDPLRLLYFGRLVADKGVHTAVEALGILKRRGLIHGVHLTILGSGHPDYERQLHEMVAEEGIRDSVEFVGKVARKEVPEWLGRFDVFLFTSIWPEPMARSVMEAMAAGLLVIGSEVGGQTEMLQNGGNALTFLPDHAEGLADQIEFALRNPIRRAQLALAGQALVLQQFTLERMVDQIEEYLYSITASAPALAVGGA